MWHYRTMSRNEVNQDPVEGEFFAPEEGYAAALVRESIQNMLDNRAGKDPVHARFAFGRLDGPEHTLASSQYLKDLLSHLQALAVPYRPQPSESITYLVVEDAGTRGLCGDETHHSDAQQSDDEPKNDFYYFWRNVGRSRKQSTDRGRWGLGKTVFPASSRVLSFFGLTHRSSDDRELLMGQFVGKIHEIDGDKFAAYAYFGHAEQDGFALPLETTAELAHFAQTFGLRRNGQAGLSVVIPFPHQELKPEALLREVIRNYYLPILQGELIVYIDGEPEETILVDADSVGKLAAGVDDATQQVIAFAADVVACSPEIRISLRLPPAGAAPTWDAVAEIFAQVDITDLRRRYEEGELIALRAPVRIEQTTPGGMQTTSYFDVYLRKDPRLERGRGDFVRQGLTISRVDRPPRGAVRGLVLVNDPPLSGLLGDSEGPAHTRWEERREGVKKYRHGSTVVRFVSRALQDLSEYLARQDAGVDENALQDIFYVPEEGAAASKNAPVPRKKGKKNVPPVVIPPIQRKPRAFDVRQIQGGFTIVGANGASAIPESLTVRVAYETEDGTAQRSYSPFDFDLSRDPIEIISSAAQFRADGNLLEVIPSAADFRIEVRGFDVNRDLDVVVKD